MMRISLILITLFVLVNSSDAQDTLYISLDNINNLVGQSAVLKKQKLKLDQSHAEHNQIKENWLPDVFIGTTWHHLEGASLNTDGRIFSDLDRQSRWLGGDLELNWDIGKTIYQAKAKKQNISGTIYQNQHERNQLILSTIQQYYSYISYQHKIELYESLISIKSKQVDGLENAKKEGIVLASELLLAKSNLKRLQIMRLSNINNSKATESALLDILNENSKIIKIEDNLDQVSLVDVNDLDGKKMSDHPSILNKLSTLASLDYDKKALTKSILIPDASLNFTTGPFGESYGNTFYTNAINAKLGWNIPLGQLFYNGSNKVADAKLKMQKIEIEAEEISITNKINLLRDQLIMLKEYITLTEEASQLAQSAMEANLARMDAKVGTNLEVIQAQEEYLMSKIMHIDAIAQYNIFQYELYFALGKNL